MLKPSPTGFDAACAPLRPGRGRVHISTNLPVVVASTLYYELMVAYETTDGIGQKGLLEDMFKTVHDGFGDFVDSRARSRPKELQHVYEWGENGSKRGRLWRLKRSRQTDDGFTVSYNFTNSRKVAPIPDILKQPGPSGKYVSKSAVFRRKAEVIESGVSVTVRRRTARFLAMPASQADSVRNRLGITFSRGPVTVRSPGGKEATGGFQRAYKAYFGTGMATRHLKSRGFFDRPPRTMRVAGERVPAIARKARFSNRGGLDTAARAAVTAAGGTRE